MNDHEAAHDDLKQLWDALPDDVRDECDCEYSPVRDVWWMECGYVITDSISRRKVCALLCHAAEEWLLSKCEKYQLSFHELDSPEWDVIFRVYSPNGTARNKCVTGHSKVEVLAAAVKAVREGER